MTESIEKKITTDRIEIFWSDLSDDKKAALIKASMESDLEEAILPALKGLYDSHLSVRSQARKTIEFIRTKLRKNLDNPPDSKSFNQAMKSSAVICSLFFTRLFPVVSEKEREYGLQLLLGFRDSGAHYAFKALSNKLVTSEAARRAALAVPDYERLGFIGEYLKTKPVRRLKFADFFKHLILSIKNQDAVIKFYADLFDAQQDADPFLLNLKAELRDHQSIIKKYVKSPSPGVRCLGLKAMAMTADTPPISVIKNIMAGENDGTVRTTLYKIIEYSSLGTYANLFQPILQHMGKGEEAESYFAFKALILTGEKPLHEILDIVKQKHPGLTGHIYKEISRLSKISFYFLQDIALNPDIYIERHIEINLAAVFGIIRKRPERVVKLIKNRIKDIDDALIKDIHLFINKTNQLLKKEKQNMVTPFSRALRKLKDRQAPSGSRLRTLFSSNKLQKKIEALKKGTKNKKSTDFEGETLSDIDLTGIKCKTLPVNFNSTVLHNFKMKQSLFFNSFFKHSLFSNVDMRGATFDSVCFKNAVFINVNASGAVFKNCEFINISMLNCNFNGADLTLASFVGATISKCSFKNTQLHGVSFAYARMSAVSIADSQIEQGNFSGLKARFCRFPVQVRSDIAGIDIDLNARQFQLKIDDMPQLDANLIHQINMLIFGEFIHYGENKFIRQNKHSLLTAFDLFKPKQADLFAIIPYLLHENARMPAYHINFNPSTPHGIFGFHPDFETLEIFRRYGSANALKSNTNTMIEGLFTIGSIGSIAQNEDSDIDFWVCVTKKKIGKKGIDLLKNKFALIEKFAWNQFRTQITFFLVDIDKARKNNFGDSTTESSGSAQAMLLKEEFYRTMIHIAGKVPLWAVLPSAISRNHYDRIKHLVSSFPNLIRYIDLGDIHKISPGEFFGATIWQLFKSLKSPFKSVIKIALLEKYISENGKKPLLCNSVKDEWMNSGVNLKLAQNDPYYILLKNLISFYSQSYDHDSISLILTCFYLKLAITDIEKLQETVFGLRQILIRKCMNEWEITTERLTRFGSYKTWPYKNLTQLTRMVESFLIKKYRVVNNAFGAYGQNDINITPEDRTVLGRKVHAELSRKSNKISKNLLLSGHGISFDHLQLEYDTTRGTVAEWRLISKKNKNQPADMLIASHSIAEIGAWLIHNKLYSDNTIVGLLPNPTPVTANDLKKLLDALYQYFGPCFEKTASFNQLLQKETITHLFISLNFYAPRHQKEIKDYSVIYLTSWGEMFVISHRSGTGLTNLKAAIPDICSRINSGTLPSSSVYFQKGQLKRLYP